MSETPTSEAVAPNALTPIPLDAAALRELTGALARTGRGLIIRTADLLGGPVNMAGRFGLRQIGMNRLVQSKLAAVAEAALTRAYDLTILSLNSPAPHQSILARAAVIGSGAFGGFIGLPGFLPDATFTTLTIMREIARIASAQGENLSTDDARRACLEVFAVRSAADEDKSELGYFSAIMHFANTGRPVRSLVLAEDDL